MKKDILLPILTFFVLAFGITYLLSHYLPEIKFVRIDISSILTGFGPLLSGLLCYRLFHTHNVYRIGLSGVRPPITYTLLGLAILLPLLFITKVPKAVVAASIVTQFMYSFAEEVGWRHYLQNLTSNLSRWVWPFLIGTLWFLWHYSIVDNPVKVLTGQNLPPLIGIPVSILLLSLFSFLWGDLTIKTKSILLPTVAHAITKYGDMLSIGIVVTLLLILQIFWYKLKLGQSEKKTDFHMRDTT